MLFQTSTKLTFGLSDVFVVTVIARNTINGVGSLVFPDRILRFGKNMPQSLKRFFCNFNVKAVQNSLDGFRNTLNVRNNRRTSRCFPFIRRLLVVTGLSYGEKLLYSHSPLRHQKHISSPQPSNRVLKLSLFWCYFSTYEKYVGQKYPPQKKNYFFVSFNNDRGLSLDDKTKDCIGGSTFVTWGHTTRVLFTVKICIFERSNEKN